MANGLEVRVPYCDHRLIEFTYALPWTAKMRDGKEKGLLRTAFASLLPQEVAERRKAPYPATQDPYYSAAIRKELAVRLCDPLASSAAKVLDTDKARRFLTENGLPASPDSVAIESAVELCRWWDSCSNIRI